MLRMQRVPEMFYSPYDDDDDNVFDDWFVPPKHCRTNQSSGNGRASFANRSRPSVRASQPNWTVEQIPVERAPKPFKAVFDLRSFDPSDISVKLDDNNNVVVQAKSPRSSFGYFSGQPDFYKRVPLPDNVDQEQLKCTFDQFGQLQIEAPLLRTAQTVKQPQTKPTQAPPKPTQSYSKPTASPVEPKKAAVVKKAPVAVETKTEAHPEVVIEDIGPF